ncbi:MAG: hypothetical protein CME59_17570 [Halioglobus sp.]|nr:hypothetical protein [Halioglobus sp.]
MNLKRKGDPQGGRTHFRSDRIQQEGGKWYFSTREGTLEGPYDTVYRAQEALQAYITAARFELISPNSNLSLVDNT